MKNTKRRIIPLILILIGIWFSSSAQAVPSFARQTGLDCSVCHTSFPQLTAFGRQFKLNGYTMSNGQTTNIPLALTLTPSFTHTQKDQTGGAAPTFGDNNNFALNEASVFYAGRLFGSYADDLFGKDGAAFANKIGIFLQTTYDGVDHSTALDDFEVRYADQFKEGDRDVTYGFYANNTPTLEDPWNTTPSWGFPFSSSSLAATPDASPLINGGLDGQVIGLGGYMSLWNGLYIDVAGYDNLSSYSQKKVGIDPADETQVKGTAPYWRLAYESNWDGNSLEVGTFGLSADTLPGRDGSAGSDHTTDTGVDSQFQTTLGINAITARTSYIHEYDNWHASQTLGNTTNSHDNLNTFNLSASDWRDLTYGGTIQYFVTTGDNDSLLYSNSIKGSPDSRGWIFEADWIPFNKQGGLKQMPSSRVKITLQYVMYDEFNGSSTNYDGAGTDAKDNNTLYLQTWFAF